MRDGFLQPYAAVLTLSLALLAGCDGKGGSAGEDRRGAPADRPADAAEGEIAAWVDVYYPESAHGGYTLLLYRRRHPTLIDLNGRVVHAWPQVRAAGRARLLPNGNLLVIAQDGAVREHTWEGEPVWEHRLEGDDFPHHDVIELASGSRLILAHDMEQRLDYLLEVTRAGEVAWSWAAAEHLAAELPRAGEVVNRTHVNSVHELGENRWWQAGDERFRPGNILISARNLNALYIIDKPSGKVVWSYYGELDHQHEALMVPPGRPGAGNILVFNNGMRDLYSYRKSSILEIDPTTGEVVWSYEAPSFFSSTGGTQQSLGNGNVLVTSSRGGRIFEITRQGKIVWQLSPSYKPMRVERYGYDHCPQLAALPAPTTARVERRNPRRHVDEDLYTFALPHQTRQIRLGRQEMRVLRETTVCRRLLLPERPELSIGYGVKPRQNQPTRDIEVELAVTLQAVTEPEPRVLLQRTERFELAPEDTIKMPEREPLSLDEAYSLQQVELCLAATAPGGQRPAPPVFFWDLPGVRGGADHRVADARETPDPVDPAVKAVQDRHLKALGYID